VFIANCLNFVNFCWSSKSVLHYHRLGFFGN